VPRKRKTLPKDFDALCESATLDELIAVFDACELDARGSGYGRATALSSFRVPDELVRWLVGQGLDVDTPDATYDRTPLYERAGTWRPVDVFLELGADVNRAEKYGGTPLHAAWRQPDNLRTLLAHGADVRAVNMYGDTPLRHALRSCASGYIEDVAPAARLLLDAGSPLPDDTAELVTRIGTDFEFRRDSFNPDSLAATDAALSELYALFDVPPVPRRSMHDGVSRIEVPDGDARSRFGALWSQLVPGSGAAPTVQGEVIRLSGRLAHEILGNGAGNWDAGFRAMADALGAHLVSGTAAGDPAEIGRTLAVIRTGRSDGPELEQAQGWAIEWIVRNPDPIALPKPAYER
jgi:hypothetical protein